jgi:ABC-type dipeptide/oligopeptide/nickel transport system ATPase component
MSVVAERCESISVMRQGAIVEAGTTRAVIDSPRHPFTAELVRDLTRSPGTGQEAGG